MVTADEIFQLLGTSNARNRYGYTGQKEVDPSSIAVVKQQLSDEVFAAIDRVKAKHPEGLGRQNACKGFEEEMKKLFGIGE